MEILVTLHLTTYALLFATFSSRADSFQNHIMDKDLPQLFSAIDTVLSLHYASSISTPKVYDLCAKATRLVHKRIDSSTLERILAYDASLYRIISNGGSDYDFGVAIPKDTSIARFGSLLPLRRRHFETLVEKGKNESSGPVSLSSLAEVENQSVSPRKASVSPTKASRLKIEKSPTKDMKNNRSRFLFKEKMADVESAKANGLSLLERIRLKEKLQKEALDCNTPQERYASLIHSKMPVVYDVLYELSSTSGPKDSIRNFTSIPLAKVVSIVCDSVQFAVAESEIRDTIKALEHKLPNIQTLERDGVWAVKVFDLDRENDLRLLKQHVS